MKTDKIADLITLIKDYYDAAQIGAAMDDPTDYDTQCYDRMMQALMRRTEQLLDLLNEQLEPSLERDEEVTSELRPDDMSLDELLALKAKLPEPVKVVHCGSTTRAREAFAQWQLKDTLAFKDVATIGAHKQDADLGITPEQAIKLDILHLHKIERADEVLILNVGGYIGPSTQRELEHAQGLGKRIRWLEPPDDGGTPLTYELLYGSECRELETTTSLSQLVALIQAHVQAGEEFDVFLTQNGEDIGTGYYVCLDQEQYVVAEEIGIARGLLKAINEQIAQLTETSRSDPSNTPTAEMDKVRKEHHHAS